MFETPVHKAVYSALTANGTLLTKITGVYDHVPQDIGGNENVFPYVNIGEDVVTEYDTDAVLGGSVSITVHAWSRYYGKKEVKDIMGEIYATLHRAEFSETGFRFISCDFESSQTLLDADGLTRHGILTFRILIERL